MEKRVIFGTHIDPHLEARAHQTDEPTLTHHIVAVSATIIDDAPSPVAAGKHTYRNPDKFEARLPQAA